VKPIDSEIDQSPRQFTRERLPAALLPE
jgi:hypothetical protein